MPQSMGRSPAAMAARASTISFLSLGWTTKPSGDVVSAWPTSPTSWRGMAVGTSGTALSAPPRTRAQAPLKVLERGAGSISAATSSSASSTWRLSAAMASACSTVMGGPASGAGVCAS
jgi:hypothetical protein